MPLPPEQNPAARGRTIRLPPACHVAPPRGRGRVAASERTRFASPRAHFCTMPRTRPEMHDCGYNECARHAGTSSRRRSHAPSFHVRSRLAPGGAVVGLLALAIPRAAGGVRLASDRAACSTRRMPTTRPSRRRSRSAASSRRSTPRRPAVVHGRRHDVDPGGHEFRLTRRWSTGSAPSSRCTTPPPTQIHASTRVFGSDRRRATPPRSGTPAGSASAGCRRPRDVLWIEPRAPTR